MRLGLTGGIASGKTTIEDKFKCLGYSVFDTDKADFLIRTGALDVEQNKDILLNDTLVNLVKDVSRETTSKLKAQLPNLYNHSGEFSREALLSYINDDQFGTSNLETYNNIINPASNIVYAEWCKQVQPPSVLSSAVLIERGNMSFIDALFIIYVSEETQLNNLMRRQNERGEPISYADAKKAKNRQYSFKEKLERAETKLGKNNIYVIDNEFNNYTKNPSIF